MTRFSSALGTLAAALSVAVFTSACATSPAPAVPAVPAAAPTAAVPAAAAAVTTASGVVYQSLRDGTGASPKASDTVHVHYRGTFPESGKEFDSSYKRGQSINFPLVNVIPCWTEGMQKMKVGGKAKLTCPPSTAYGARGAPGSIPPNATISFEVELLGIKKSQ